MVVLAVELALSCAKLGMKPRLCPLWKSANARRCRSISCSRLSLPEARAPAAIVVLQAFLDFLKELLRRWLPKVLIVRLEKRLRIRQSQLCSRHSMNGATQFLQGQKSKIAQEREIDESQFSITVAYVNLDNGKIMVWPSW